ncbi:MBL fold metallo-hydrolase [Enterococcus bulliens]
MKITRFITGAAQENCYLLEQNGASLIIDPGAEANTLIQAIKHSQTKLLAILLTHTHYDHIGAVTQVRETFDVPVYVSELEQDWLQDPIKNLSGRHPEMDDLILAPAEYEFELFTPYMIGPFEFTVVPTPGHSMGSVSFIFDEVVFCGDALFKGSIGRTDLYSGNLEQLLTSITTQLFTLPDNTIALSGHGEQTTIGDEKQTNPFFTE